MFRISKAARVMEKMLPLSWGFSGNTVTYITWPYTYGYGNMTPVWRMSYFAINSSAHTIVGGWASVKRPHEPRCSGATCRVLRRVLQSFCLKVFSTTKFLSSRTLAVLTNVSRPRPLAPPPTCNEEASVFPASAD